MSGTRYSGSDNGCSAERKSSDRRATSRGESAMGGEAKPAIIVKNLPIRAAGEIGDCTCISILVKCIV